MTSAPADLLAFRTNVRNVTGLGAVDVGIVGDGAHQRTGGYHEGRDVLTSIGRYHAPASANVGSSGEDYSARAARDRNGLTNSASGSDIGSAWPNGGRSAWLRWNSLLYQEMRDRPQNLPALRAINVCLDGHTKQRYDQAHRGDGLIASTDTVDTHTHLEFWRDTEGGRNATFDRIVQLMHAAIDNRPAPSMQGGDEMELSTIVPGTKTSTVGGDRPFGTSFADMYITLRATLEGEHEPRPGTPMAGLVALAKGAPQLLAATAADEQRDNAALAAITALTTAIQQAGGSVEAAPIIAAVKAVGDDTHTAVTALQQQNADLMQRIADLQAELAEVKASTDAQLSPAERAAVDGAAGH